MKDDSSWTLQGAEGRLIYGNTHQPGCKPRGGFVIAHGFKGYKDYGFFPRLAERCAAAGSVAHRFNFSHSGMTNNIATFERPDLFERDTWNKQVHDLRTVIAAMHDERIAGRGLPFVVFGHSRGGVTALLTAGRFAADDEFPQPAGIITAAAPSHANPFPDAQMRILRERGWIESPSSRTGQSLRVGRAFVDEMLADPQAHDVLMQARRIRCPVLIIHGEHDPTVPPGAAMQIHEAIKDSELTMIPAADHVFNTPNPLPADQPASPQLQTLIESCTKFAQRVCAG